MPLSFLLLESWIHEFYQWGTEYHILDADLEYVQPLGDDCESLARYCHLTSIATLSSKAIPLFYYAIHFRMMENMVIPVKEHCWTSFAVK